MGFIEQYTSLLWDIEYFTVGSFEIYLPATAENLSLFQMDRIVARSDDTNNYSIIEAIAIEHDAENGDFMTISDRFLQSLLTRRIVFPTAYSTKITGENCPQLSTLAKTYGNMVKYVLLGSQGYSWILAENTGVGSIVSGVVGTKGGAVMENVMKFSQNYHLFFFFFFFFFFCHIEDVR